METSNKNHEHEPAPKDISAEFLTMTVYDFIEFLRSHKDEPAISITVDWTDTVRAKRLKAFLEDFSSTIRSSGQKRLVTIRATKEQHDQDPNVFASGVRWEKI
jgi:hypothetical protein